MYVTTYSEVTPLRYDFTIGKKDRWRRGLKNLIRWIKRGRDHIYGGLLSGGLIPEGEGAPGAGGGSGPD
jgi:hypothetical protein